MKIYKKTIYVVMPITIIFLFLTIVFSILQSKNTTCVLYVTLANICICILTSGLLICVQSFIGFYVARKEAILSFYKEVMILEKNIINYPYQNTGFILAQNGLKDIQTIISGFYDRFKWAYMMIDVSNKKNKVISSVILLYEIYGFQIKEFLKLEALIKKALEYLEIPEAELLSQGRDIPKETKIHNINLQNQMSAIEAAFNDAENNKKRNECLDVIEEYLF